MPSDELTYGDIGEIATRDAELNGLVTVSAERDESLFVTIHSARSGDGDASRREVTFWTSGTGAFLVDFDDRWTWQVFAYDRADQVEAVHDIMKVVGGYLRGAGEEREFKKRLRQPRRAIIMSVDGERIVLEPKERKSQ
jgi:hypothetical protein